MLLSSVPVIQANGAEFLWLFEVFGWPTVLCFHINWAPTSILATNVHSGQILLWISVCNWVILVTLIQHRASSIQWPKSGFIRHHADRGRWSPLFFCSSIEKRPCYSSSNTSVLCALVQRGYQKSLLGLKSRPSDFLSLIPSLLLLANWKETMLQQQQHFSFVCIGSKGLSKVYFRTFKSRPASGFFLHSCTLGRNRLMKIATCYIPSTYFQPIAIQCSSQQCQAIVSWVEMFA